LTIINIEINENKNRTNVGPKEEEELVWRKS
jgi:hypothetical protein